MKKNNYLPWATVVGLAASLAIALPVFAATGLQVQVGVGAQAGGGWGDPGPIHRPTGVPAILGAVDSVNGTTLTVTAKMMMRPMPMMPATSAAPAPAAGPAMVYTVDASNAQIYKGNSTSTVSISSIATGDIVVIQGTVSGSNITATVIRDGIGGVMGQPGKRFGYASSTPHATTPPIQGNGEPVIGGAVTAVNGSSVTVTNASNVTYTVDVTSATVIKNGTSTAATNIAVGDNLIVQGTVNGTAVTASSVIDEGAKANGSASGSASASAGVHAAFGLGGIFNAIGGFFHHLFGF